MLKVKEPQGQPVNPTTATTSWRIAHVTATFPPYQGGTGNVCYHNARELARRGHNVTVFTAAHSTAPSVEQRDGLTIRRLKPLLRVGNAPVLPGLLNSLRGFDLIHLHYPFFGGELTTLAAKFFRIPLVITYHQDVLLQGWTGKVELGLRHTAGRLTLRSAAKLLFTSQDYGRTSYVQPLLKGRAAFQGELPNGVDSAKFGRARATEHLRARHNLSHNDRVVLLVAGLDTAHYFKGVSVLLEALARLEAHVKAVIVGDGDLRPRYAATAASLGLHDRVIFAGRVSDDELPDYYALADVTVLPSLTRGEAFGLVLLESLASGTPVIASDLPGVRTVVDAPNDGRLVQPGDSITLAAAINDIVSDPVRGRAMGEAGKVRVARHYDWAVVGSQLEDIYGSILSEGASC